MRKELLQELADLEQELLILGVAATNLWDLSNKMTAEINALRKKSANLYDAILKDLSGAQ